MTSHEHEPSGEAFELIAMDGIRVMVGPGDRAEVIRISHGRPQDYD